jgi:hypothetical protein
MQNYIDFAKKNGITLINTGKCQFCGANTQGGIHECIEIFNLGFQEIDFSNFKNHIYRFLIVDAHTLQHPEIHGRWSNHFHLTRLHLIFKYGIKWTYQLSPKLSDYLNKYKVLKQDEYLIPPEILERGNITTSDIKEKSNNPTDCKDLIEKWALEVYEKWKLNHDIIDNIAKGFLNKN